MSIVQLCVNAATVQRQYGYFHTQNNQTQCSQARYQDPYSENGLLHKLMSALCSMCLASELPRNTVVFAKGRPLLFTNAFDGFAMPLPVAMVFVI